MIKNIIFDLDGTLVNSSNDIIDCLRRAYAALGLEPTRLINDSLIGPPLKDMIKLISPESDDFQDSLLIKSFRDYYDNSGFCGTKLYTGVQDLLERCRNSDIRSFIATNKPEKSTKRLIEILNMDFFLDLVTIDNVQGFTSDKEGMFLYLIKKWSIKRDATFVIGDSASDIIAAHQVGLRSVAILNGYGDADEIKRSNPEYCLNRIDELAELIFKTGNT